MKRILLSAWMISVICSGLSAGIHPVSTPAEYNDAIKKVQPGDTIKLSNGVWKDFKMVFKGEGTAENPIVLTVETLGLCTIEGESNLRISGNYLVVEGLVFINGHTPTKSVVEFKTSSTEAARYTTMRNCVIDHFNNPGKTTTDNWVNLCGQYNTVEYCYFGGKKNDGTTFIVSPNGEGHTENFHRIYRNYFGMRPKLGANGGETMRIGTSHYSMENSNTIVEGNFFEHCNGEVEIISVKSCGNRIIDNTFWECEGSLVLRHGNQNEVSGNYIIGNGKKYTGGIRIINEGHKIYNNYLSGLTGVDFRGPLVIMNGVPNSPVNRYHQVKDVDIAFNTFMDCALPWQFCVGSDEERSLCPENVRIANNIIYSPGEEELIKVYDCTDGFSFENNVLQSAYGIEKGTGFLDSEIKIRRGNNGMILPLVADAAAGDFNYVKTDIGDRERVEPKAIGAFQLTGKVVSEKEMATNKNCGPGFQWDAKSGREKHEPVIHQVTPGKDNLVKAIRNSGAGDILELADGEYINTRKLLVEHPLTIRARAGAATRPVIKMDEVTANTVVMFEMESGTTLQVDGIALSGNASSAKPTKYAFITGKENNLDHYNLFINNCEIYDFKEEAGAILKAFKTAFIDTLQITNTV
ncbi:MAG: polysaccharide lyase 6 family protein, partial [Bacteroides sp.]|nr:polysaccharide lyase 6 family protein [Bacteroides sp.]